MSPAIEQPRWLPSRAVPHRRAGADPVPATAEGWGGQGSGGPSTARLVGLCFRGGRVPSAHLCLASQQQLLAWALPAPCFSACSPSDCSA